MIYPFKCERCHIEFTVTLSVEAYEKLENKLHCPICYTTKVRRVLTFTPVHFKGEGFTKTAKEKE